ncbi:DUF2989 domain-containing protein [Aliiglaciecola lipolytica]|uniref:Lipoprotein n=1 Tax=Aliiglaciecola lipolytica E3 TaxID=1127673 RepID=K6YWI7_9ALTE|nr:DUF2989 domain-containing protein [Aliiglaciecola lipolytica]GAC15615.1 hypothetical protein GLIP_2994 [Aliiglaciecola lipolytica E3]
MRYWLIALGILLSGCENDGVADASMWQICDTYQDICDNTHSGALCSIPRSEVIRDLARQREQISSINTYIALKSLDAYKSCLEDAFVSEAVRNKSDKQSQITTIRKIPEIQKELIASTRSMSRPEVNLWLWTYSQNQDNWESMVNGFETAQEVHVDVYVALMTKSAKSNMSEGVKYARMALEKADLIKDIQPSVYEFYVGYYLDKNDLQKAAIWQGLYSALDKNKAEVNAQYFKLFEKMSPSQIHIAQKKVDDLLFDAKWLNKDMSTFPENLK